MAVPSKRVGVEVGDEFDDDYDDTYDDWYDQTARGSKKRGAGASKNVHQRALQPQPGRAKQAAIAGTSRLTTGEAKMASSEEHPSGAHQQTNKRGKLSVAKAAQQDNAKVGASEGTEHTSERTKSTEQPEAEEKKEEVAPPKPVVDSWDMYS